MVYSRNDLYTRHPRLGSILVLTVFIGIVSLGSACRVGEYECSAPNQRSTCHSLSELCDRNKDCYWGDDEDKCDVVPRAIVYCFSNYPKDGYYRGHSIECRCSTEYRGSRFEVHKGTAQWYRADEPVGKPEDTVKIRFNDTDVDTGYDCITRAGYGAMGDVIPLRPKFAYLESKNVKLFPKVVTICKNDVFTSEKVTCSFPFAKVNPAPQFELTGGKDSANLADPRIGELNQGDYTVVLDTEMGPEGGGEMEVTCQVTNVKFSDLKDKVTDTVIFRRPPPHPPVVEILGQTFQGVSEVNMAALDSNFTGHLSCRVDGGFPEPRITNLACGSNVGFSDGVKGTVRFQNVMVTRSMHDTVCVCTAEHESGCYDYGETKVKLKVMFPPGTEPQKEQDKGENEKGDKGANPGNNNGDKENKFVSLGIPLLLVAMNVLLVIIIIIRLVGQRRSGQEPVAERVRLQDAKA